MKVDSIKMMHRGYRWCEWAFSVCGIMETAGVDFCYEIIPKWQVTVLF